MKILLLGPKKHTGIIGGVITHTELMLRGMRELYPGAHIEVLDTSFTQSGRRMGVYDSLKRIMTFDYSDYDIVYINSSLYFKSMVKLGVTLRRIMRTLGPASRAQVVIQFHGGDVKRLGRIKRALLCFLFKDVLDYVSKIRFLTGEQKRQFEILFNVDEPLTEKVNNLVDVEDEVEIDSYDTLRVLLLSRLDPGKGIEEFIECARLMCGNDRVKFYAAGDGILRHKLKKAASRLPNLVYAGILDEAARNELIKECNVFCLLSDSEGMPYALLENMAAGNIPIVTGRGAMGEIVVGNSAGLVIPKSAIALRDALFQLQSDPDFAKRLSSCAHATIKKHYSFKKMRESLEALT